jgi:hypothetical protein
VTAHQVTLAPASQAAIERVVAAFRARVLEVVQAGGSGEVRAVAVIESGVVTHRSHLEGPREYPLRRKP